MPVVNKWTADLVFAGYRSLMNEFGNKNNVSRKENRKIFLLLQSGARLFEDPNILKNNRK